MGERKRKQGTLGKAKDMHPHPDHRKGRKYILVLIQGKQSNPYQVLNFKTNCAMIHHDALDK